MPCSRSVSSVLEEVENISQILWMGNRRSFQDWLGHLTKGFCPNVWEPMHAQITWNCLGGLWLLYESVFIGSAVQSSRSYCFEELRHSNEQVTMCFKYSCTSLLTDCGTTFQDLHVYWTSLSMNPWCVFTMYLHTIVRYVAITKCVRNEFCQWGRILLIHPKTC